MRHYCRLLVAETSSSVVESVPTTTQSRRGGLISRLCPSYNKFSVCFKKLNCCKCVAGKSIAGSKVGILAGSKAGMIGGSKISVEEGSISGLHPSAAGKCGWLRKFLCCSRRGGKCCTCCRKKADAEADGSRRRSNATSRMSKKQSRSSSTAVEVSVSLRSCLAMCPVTTRCSSCKVPTDHSQFVYLHIASGLFKLHWLRVNRGLINDSSKSCKISGFRRFVLESFALLECYTA